MRIYGLDFTSALNYIAPPECDSEQFADLRSVGDELWQRFNGGKDGTLWYYRALVEAFKSAGPNPVVEELDRVVGEMERLEENIGGPLCTTNLCASASLERPG